MLCEVAMVLFAAVIIRLEFGIEKVEIELVLE
jgi:hypothetical protein